MPDKEPVIQNEFMIEKIKERPINKKRLVRRILITTLMAVLFGLVSCFTFFLLEKGLSNVINKRDIAPIVYFPEDTEEMLPEDMLSDSELQWGFDGEGMVLEEEQIQEILSGVNLNLTNYRQLYAALTDYAAVLQKSMVTLTAIQSNIDWMNDINESEKSFAGVIIANTTNELLILTDYSYLEDVRQVSVTFHNGAKTTAEFRGCDVTNSLAVVTINLEGFPQKVLDEITVANQGSSNYKMAGTPVIALGNPMGSNNSMGVGMITAASMYAYETDNNYKILQTDIVGSPNASGVLFNLHGQVVGIITKAGHSEGMENIIFAYGISDLKKRMEKLSNNQSIAYAGIRGVSVDPVAHEEQHIPYGAYVKEVEADSPAMKGGLRSGDVITKLDETDVVYYSDYITFMSVHKPDDKVTVTVNRIVQSVYRPMTLEMTLGELRQAKMK